MRDADTQTETLRRYGDALDRLWNAITESDSVDALLDAVLALVVDLARLDVAIMQLVEGDWFRSKSAFGLSLETAVTFARPLAASALAETSTVSSVTTGVLEHACLREKDVRSLYFLPMLHAGQLVAGVYMGTREGRELSREDTRLLESVAARAAASIARQLAVDSLHQAVRARDAVLGVVAHDLRNPITLISIAASTLLQRLTDPSARRAVERIARGAQRADRLVQDLLDIHAIEDGMFAVDKRPVEITDVILAALESQQGVAASSSIIIASDLSPQLPAIEADEERILEVLENLIGNALKFTEPSGSVTVGASSGEGEILFWVKDDGPGIPPEQLPFLFSRFWQAKRTDRRGVGLGLTICKAIVEAHGGRIWAESVLGAGTTMFFVLPASHARAGAPKSVAATDVASILLVDDRPENLLALRAILEGPNYRLVTARSGEEALSLALREPFSVALIDIAMPGMNGLDVAVHLKELERSRDIPIIFITAFGNDPEEIHRAYAAGGVDYLVKPLDAEIVRKKVAVFVDLSRRRMGSQRPSPERSEHS